MGICIFPYRFRLQHSGKYPQPMKSFPCKASFLIKALTVFVSVILLMLGMYALPGVGDSVAISTAGIGMAGGMLGLISAFYFLFDPRRVVVDDSTLSVHFRLRRVDIPLHDVRFVRRVGKMPVVRLGSLGYFGFLGTGMDGTKIWVKDIKRMVHIQTERNSYVLSCDRPSELVASVQSATAEKA